ncbi:MAG: GNAT family N-acetyltransferase [Chryseosolibacter sp.]
MKYILETARLRLREFTLDDGEFIVDLMNSPGWLKFIGDRNVRTTGQAQKYLENGPIKAYQENGFGLSMVERKDDDVPVGMCGILQRPTLDTPDIGFAFLPAFNGKGYALEIASAVMTYAQSNLGLSRIAAITLRENDRSIRLLEKLGMTYRSKFSFPGSEEELLLYGNFEEAV